jgi:hypothetical protein
LPKSKEVLQSFELNGGSGFKLLYICAVWERVPFTNSKGEYFALLLTRYYYTTVSFDNKRQACTFLFISVPLHSNTRKSKFCLNCFPRISTKNVFAILQRPTTLDIFTYDIQHAAVNIVPGLASLPGR